MSGNRVSETGKKVSEVDMSTAALIEAKNWTDTLMNQEFKGRGDKEYLARYRLSVRTGVAESYLYRLQYKTREMKDVAGSVYRALMIAKAAYDRACEANETAADRYRDERLGMRGHNEETDEKLHAESMGVASSKTGAANRKEA